MRRRVITMHFISRQCVYVRGWRTRELLLEVSGRPPVWSTIQKAWTVQQDTAIDALAVAESRGIDVRTTGEVPRIEWPEPEPDVDQPVIEQDTALW